RPTGTATNSPEDTATTTTTPAGTAIAPTNTPTHTPVPPTSTNTSVPPTNTPIAVVSSVNRGPILMPNTGMGAVNSGSGRMIVGALMIVIALGGLAIRFGMNRRSQ